MIISVRKFLFEDRQLVEGLSHQNEAAKIGFREYLQKHFSEAGEEKGVMTGHPDTVLVALLEGRTVGYVHFYRDHYAHSEKVKVALVADPSVPGVQEALEHAFEEA